MCGRYTFTPSDKYITRFDIKNDVPQLLNNYNVAPGSAMPIVIKEDDGNKSTSMKWGLIPFWARDPKIGYNMINARCEKLSEKPSFKRPLISKRCIVPASGFYEWKKTAEEKTPYYIKMKNDEVFAFAGLYDIWTDPHNKQVYSYTIITCPPNETLSSIHNRMPVIFSKEAENIWLDLSVRDPQYLSSLLKAYEGEDIEAYPVSRMVNDPKNNFPALIKKQTLF